MRFHSRNRVVLISALVAVGLMLLGVWAMRSQPAMHAAARAESAAASDRSTSIPAPTPASTASPSKSTASSDDASFGTFRGRVINAATREPVREFEVAFHGSQPTKAGDEAPGSQTFRAENGRFEWQYLVPGTWRVTVSARGYQIFALRDLQIRKGEATPEVVLPMRPGYRLTGRIHDASSGVGIASANINFREGHIARHQSDWRTRPSTKSAEDGSFVLEGVPPGLVTLQVRAQDYIVRELNVIVGAKTTPLEIALSTGATISGRLTASDGVTPVAGQASCWNRALQYGVDDNTSEHGTFSFRQLPAGRYRVTGSSGGAVVSQEIVLAENEQVTGVVLALGTGRSIRGVVTGLRPEDLEHVAISLRREDGGGSSVAGVDSQGAYVLRGVAAGRVFVHAQVMSRFTWKKVEMPADADLTVNLDFPRGARLSGRVTRNGKPVADEWLRLRPVAEPKPESGGTLTTGTGGSATVTTEKGDYSMDGLETGEYRVLVGESFTTRVVRVADDTVFDIDMSAAQFAGRVLEEGGTVPVTGADVSIWAADFIDSPIWLRDRSDDFGQFGLTGLQPGEFVLTVYKPEYALYRERISYESPVADMTIRLQRDRGVEVSVRTGDGKRPQAVSVHEVVRTETASWSGIGFQLSFDENGLAYIPSALAGSTLSFSARGYAPVSIREWNGQSLTLDLRSRDAR
jgi:Carboxypeptidase regulatory-like domain